MTNISRRSFLKGALVLTAAASVPMGLKALRSVPVLYGDGVHDDTKALQALFDGQEIIVEGQTIRVHNDGDIILDGGRFAITAPLTITRDRTVVRNTQFDHYLQIADTKTLCIDANHCLFEHIRVQHMTGLTLAGEHRPQSLPRNSRDLREWKEPKYVRDALTGETRVNPNYTMIEAL